VAAREERSLTLYAHERATVLVLLPTPYRADLKAEVRADYPAR
jgi:hypothetical protein